MNRLEIQAEALAEAAAREELDRWPALCADVAVLRSQASWPRRIVALLAGSRLGGLLARDRLRVPGGSTEAEQRAAKLRRRRFRLSRRKRVLEAGVAQALGAERRRPRPPRQAVSPNSFRNYEWIEAAPQPLEDDGESRRALYETWGAAMRRRILTDLIAGGGDWCKRPARVLVDPSCPAPLGEAVAGLGLEVVDSAAGADVAIVIDRRGRVGFDWLLAGEHSVASSGELVGELEDPDALARALRRSIEAPAFCIRIAARDWGAADQGGDAALARSLARALGERGHQALLQVDADSDLPAGQCLDVLLVLRGRRAGEPTPGRLNLIWQISHPSETDRDELNRYDRVLVASTRHAEHLRDSVDPVVEPLLQFTDPELFRPAPASGPSHEIAFVGNWRGEFRQIVWDALQAGHPPALYGRGWDLLAPEHAVAEYVPHEQLHRIYSSCEILLCDHWEDMRRLGFVSNRVFDALACGAFVIADDNPALAEELPGGVETYSTTAELGAKLDRYLGDRESREQIARHGRAIVLANHTVERRAEQLLAIATAAVRDCERPEVAHLSGRGPGERLGEPEGGENEEGGARRGAAAGWA